VFFKKPKVVETCWFGTSYWSTFKSGNIARATWLLLLHAGLFGRRSDYSMRGERISLHELTALRVDLIGERSRKPMPRSRKQASGGRDSRGNLVATRAFKVRKRALDATDQETEHQQEPTEADDAEGGPKKKRRRRDHYIPDLLPFLHPRGVAEETTQIVADSNGGDGLPSSVGSTFDIWLVLNFNH
jgi:hypothetical protein